MQEKQAVRYVRFTLALLQITIQARQQDYAAPKNRKMGSAWGLVK
jgi:hypothetical protein